MSRIVLALAAFGAAIAQPVRTGQMLVATRASRDPDFARTVVLVVHAGPEGVVGLMLNRPADADIRRVLPELREVPVPNKTVYAGGPLPIGTNGLVRSRVPPNSAVRVGGDIWMIANQAAIAREITARPGAARVYIGQSGWSVKQMEGELARRLWIVSLAPASAVFDPEPESLWVRMIGRLSR